MTIVPLEDLYKELRNSRPTQQQTKIFLATFQCLSKKPFKQVKLLTER